MDELTRDLLAARDGDRLALSAAIRASQPDVWRFCSHLVGRPHADECTQDTYLRATRALPRFRGESSGRTWLLAIARRACADLVRRETRRRRLEERLGATVTAHRVTDPADRVALDALLGGLDPAQRESFVCTQVLGLSYQETAEACGVPIGTVRSRVARARAALVAQLADEATG